MIKFRNLTVLNGVPKLFLYNGGWLAGPLAVSSPRCHKIACVESMYAFGDIVPVGKAAPFCEVCGRWMASRDVREWVEEGGVVLCPEYNPVQLGLVVTSVRVRWVHGRGELTPNQLEKLIPVKNRR